MAYAYRARAGKLGYPQFLPDLDRVQGTAPTLGAGKNDRGSPVTGIRLPNLHDAIQAGKGIDLPLPR
jgi:hypothetical protein